MITTAYVLLGFGARLDPDMDHTLAGVERPLVVFSSMSLPFLLIANFSKILNNSEGYRKQLFRTGGAALAIFLLMNGFMYRYVVGGIRLFVSDPEEVEPMLMNTLRTYRETGFIACNLFVDLFLCTLFMFLSIVGSMGIGGSTPLILVAPVVLLFSYTRQPKYRELDRMIPLGGIVLIIIVVFEGLYMALAALSRQMEHLSLWETMNMFNDILSELGI